MVKLDGVFEFVSEDNYFEYLTSLGLDEEKAKKIALSKTNVEIKPVSGEFLPVSYGGREMKFPLNKEIEHVLPTGNTVWTTTTISGDTITFKTKLTADGSVGEEKVFKVTDSGVTSTSKNTKGVSFVRKYKRV